MNLGSAFQGCRVILPLLETVLKQPHCTVKCTGLNNLFNNHPLWNHILKLLSKNVVLTCVIFGELLDAVIPLPRQMMMKSAKKKTLFLKVKLMLA